jgi:hypothetical protein
LHRERANAFEEDQVPIDRGASAVVIVISRRWPKTGVRCFVRRSLTMRTERRPFVV